MSVFVKKWQIQLVQLNIFAIQEHSPIFKQKWHSYTATYPGLATSLSSMPNFIEHSEGFGRCVSLIYLRIYIYLFDFQENFTNDQYHELKNAEKLEYEIKRENSIFFEVL